MKNCDNMYIQFAMCSVHFKNENSHCCLNEAKDETLPFERMAENMKDYKSEGNSTPKCFAITTENPFIKP